MQNGPFRITHKHTNDAGPTHDWTQIYAIDQAEKRREPPEPCSPQTTKAGGLELLSKAKAMRPDVPIIMITAYGDAETKHKALEIGAEALLTDPIDFGTLRGKIDMRIERTA